MSKSLGWLVVLVGFLLLSACSQHKTETLRICYLSEREPVKRTFDIWLLEPKTGKQTNLTGSQTEVTVRSLSNPTINHQRNSVIFYSFNPMQLVELELQSGVVHSLSLIKYEASEFDLSQDGKRLVYTDKNTDKIGLVLYNFDTGLSTTLTDGAGNFIEPKFSHDGSRLAYVSDEDGTWSVGAMRVDGSGRKLLTNPFGEDRSPGWSADDRSIVFSSSRGGLTATDFDLYTVDSSGTTIKVYYDDSGYISHPVFSPDGRYTAFLSTARGPLHRDLLLKMNNAEKVINITNRLNGMVGRFGFSRDGRYLVFEHDTITVCEIVLWDACSQSASKLTADRGRHLAPSM